VILLDTDILSAMMQARPDEAVRAWLDRQAGDDIWTTTISVFEVRYGLALLEQGRRRAALEAAFDVLVQEVLAGRIAAFDLTSAEFAADIAARRRSTGRTVDFHDTQIAGIALARRASIATRNVRRFEDIGTPILDPWAAD
jgi:predicted nucleic acid-binding protein